MNYPPSVKHGQRLLRTAASYLPSDVVMRARVLRDKPRQWLHTPHEPEFELLRVFDRPGEQVLDVGANRGQSIDSLRMVLTDPEIVGVEPIPHLCAYLERSRPGVRVINQGIAGEAGQMELHIPRYGQALFDTRATLRHARAAEFLNPANFAFFRPARSGVETSLVKIGPIDDLGLNPYIIKIDVEGMDEDAIRGGLQTITSNKPALLIERPSSGTTKLLDGVGYQAVCYEPRGKRLVRAQTASQRIFNTLYFTEDHLDLLRSGGISGPD